MREDILDLDTDDGPMAVLRKRPDDDVVHPLVVMFHDGPGMREATHEFARKLAGAGYDVAVPDLYHRHGRMIGFGPAEMAADPDAGPKIMTMLHSLTDDGIQHDLDVALAAVSADRPDGATDQAACIGFCLGARAVFRTMTRLPTQFVVGAAWHPSFLVDDGDDSPHRQVDQLRGSLYLGFGEADTVMSVASMQPFIDAAAAHADRIIVDIHPGADHGFTWPGAPNYDEGAAEGSWARTTSMFAAALDG